MRTLSSPLALLCLVATFALSCERGVGPYGDCPETSLTLPAASPDGSIDTEVLQTWVRLLADPARRGRRAGSAEAHQVAGLLGQALDRIGLETPKGGRCQSYAYVESTDFNVIGHLFTSEESPWIMVSAHYDARGVHPTGAVLAGADDNGSGVAALLEIARLAKQGPPISVNVVFALFGAEEIGFVGVKTWLAHPSLDDPEIDMVINLDMVGRSLPDGSARLGYSLPRSDHRDLIPAIENAAQRSQVVTVPLAEWHEPGSLISDSTVLSEHYPSVLLSTGLHSDYHDVGDTADKVDGSQIGRATTLVLEILRSHELD